MGESHEFYMTFNIFSFCEWMEQKLQMIFDPFLLSEMENLMIK